MFPVAAVGLGNAKAPDKSQDMSRAAIILIHQVRPYAVMCAILEFSDGHISMTGFLQRLEHRLVLLATIGGVVLGVHQQHGRGVLAGVMQRGGHSVCCLLCPPNTYTPCRANPAHVHQPADGNGTANGMTAEPVFFQERRIQCKQRSQVPSRRTTGHK